MWRKGHYATYVLNRHEILNIVTELEGHPDNVAPAIFGEDESLLKKAISEYDEFECLLIGESLITNETLYCILKMNDELENKKNIMRKMLNNSVVFRSYKSLNEFIIDNR